MARFIRKDLFPLWLFIASVVGLLISAGLCGPGSKLSENLTVAGVVVFFPSLAVLAVSLVWGLVVLIIGLGRK